MTHWNPIHTARQTRQDGPVCVVSASAGWIESRNSLTKSEQSADRPPDAPDAEPTQNAPSNILSKTVRRSDRLNSHRHTRHDKNCRACVVSGVALWIGQLLLTCSDLKFSVGDSHESSRTQFTPPRQTRHRQDSFVGSGLVAWIGFNSRRLCAAVVA